MLVSRILVLIALSAFLNGCADFYGNQPPAPVFGGTEGEMQPYPNPPPAQPPQIIVTKPLEGFNRPPEMVEIKPDLPPPVAPQVPTNTTDPLAGQEQPDIGQEPETEPPVEQVKPVENITPTAPEPPREPENLKPLETFAPQSPAVGSLVMAATEDSQGGNIDSAVASIERAIRIEPRNATLYYKLALLRLDQSKPRLAEDLARKAALLAVNDNKIKKHSWLLIAKARELQNNVPGAAKAKAEAEKY